MKRKLLYFVVASLIQLHFRNSAWALSQAEFQASLKSLRESQKEGNRRLLQFGVKPSVALIGNPLNNPSTEPSDNVSSQQRAPLFILHDDGKQLRAQAGKLLFGKIYHRLIVSNTGTPAILELSEGQGLFSGLRVLGKARPSDSEGRVAIDFDRAITRSGKIIPIRGAVEDEAGGLGLEAQVFSSKMLSVLGSLASSFISGLAASQQTQTTSALGFSQTEPTGRNGILQGVSQTAADQSKRFIQESTQEKPVLVVESGTTATLYLDEEVKF